MCKLANETSTRILIFLIWRSEIYQRITTISFVFNNVWIRENYLQTELMDKMFSNQSPNASLHDNLTIAERN